MAKIVDKAYTKILLVIFILLFMALSSCGKKGALQRPPLDNNLEPVEVEKNY